MMKLLIIGTETINGMPIIHRWKWKNGQQEPACFPSEALSVSSADRVLVDLAENVEWHNCEECTQYYGSVLTR